eukprot:GHVR01047513.1.p1 GENE.GHVR01047513.1~~GHVR01047513.1.p1  ORF type:complete len:318 (+),score=42.35 GHVR01047513.1:135-1088(+)
MNSLLQNNYFSSLLSEAYGPSIVLRCVHPSLDTTKELNSWYLSIDTKELVIWSDVLQSNVSNMRRFYLSGIAGLSVNFKKPKEVEATVVGLSTSGHREGLFSLKFFNGGDYRPLIQVSYIALRLLSVHHLLLNGHNQLAEVVASSVVPIDNFDSPGCISAGGSPRGMQQMFRRWLYVFEPLKCPDHLFISLNNCLTFNNSLRYWALCDTHTLKRATETSGLYSGSNEWEPFDNWYCCNNKEAALYYIDNVNTIHKSYSNERLLECLARVGWAEVTRHVLDTMDGPVTGEPLHTATMQGNLDVCFYIIYIINIYLFDA